MVGWQVKLALAAVAVAVLMGLGLRLQHEQRRADAAEARAEAAERQAKISDAVTSAADQAHRTEVIIRDKTERAADAVQKAPGADAPVPPEVLAAWRAGIDGLRAQSGEPEGDGSGKP